jgi:integrase
MSETTDDRTYEWLGDGLFSRTRPGRDGKPETTYSGKVWIKSEQRIRVFKLKGRTDRAARRELVAIQADPEKALEARKPKVLPTAPIRFRALVDRFVAEYRSRGETEYYRHVAKSWREFFGNADVTTITRPRVEQYRDHLSDSGKSDSTTRKYVGALGTMFRWAMYSCDPPLVTVNPAVGVKRPSEPDHEVTVLSVDQEADLIATCGPELLPLVQLCISSGLRRGEALTLRWSQIDTVSDSILIHKSKTGKARSIPLTPTLTAILDRATKRDDSPLVFHNEDGRPWEGRAASRSLERALERAGIRVETNEDSDVENDYQGVYNLLRHTFGSRLAARGVPFGVIAKLMGNSVRVCEKHYIRFAQSDLRSAMGAVQPVTGSGTGSKRVRRPQTSIRANLQLVKG